jgi:hypothetical protein
VTYAGVFGALAAGTHTYVITATDKLGDVSTLSGSFTVPAASSGNSNSANKTVASPNKTLAAAALASVTSQADESAKVAWMYDDSAADSESTADTNAVDAALAAY